jgi:protein involved in polysaccharide export with SLBB domain
MCLVSPGERVGAQGISPSPEQLQIFQGLTPEQQQAILSQLGGGVAAGESSSYGGTLERRPTDQFGRTDQATRMQQEQELLRRERMRQGEEGEEEEPTGPIPVLKREDWVVVEIDYQLPPRPVPPYLQALYAGQILPGAAGNAAAGALQGAAAQAAVSQSAAAQSAVQNAAANFAGAGGATSALAASQAAQNSLAAQTGQTSTTLPVPAQQGPQALSNAAAAAALGLSDEERMRLESLMTLIRAGNPYRLSREGTLTLPGFAPIALLGLTEEQATLRLKIEPAFRGIDVRVTRLPIRKTGRESLKPFGYDLFDHVLSTFAPSTNVPVPAEYIVGSGDQLDVQLYGNMNRSLKLIVGRDGNINLPELGPVNVAGQTFVAAKAQIESRVERQMIGVHANVSMGDTRSIRVFVLGEAKFPGTYTISGLGTITSALYAAGGAKRVGSLRKIQLKRRGALVRQLDLYDLLIRGDTSDDTKLLPGDVIFIPPVGPTVSIDGEVKRPAIYEIKGESTVSQVLQLAGGLTPEADRSNAMLTRIDENQHRVIIPLDLTAGAPSLAPRNGDLVHVMRLRPTLDSGIVLQGHVYDSGSFAYRAGIRLSDVIHSVDELQPNADIHYLLIRRETPPDRRISVLSADLAAALNAPGSTADVPLMPRDRITVFDLASGRDHVIQPVLEELRVQGSAAHPTETVHIDGQVKVPGEYPLEPGMRVSDLIRAGGGAADAAYGRQAELTRYTLVSGERRTELVQVDLSAALRGDPAANLVLLPFDTLTVKEIPLWEAQENVVVRGEVRFPGRYAIRRGETLRSVIGRAGGLTEFAFPEGSVFTREWLRKREQEQLDMLAQRMQTDLTALAIGSAAAGVGGGANALSIGQTLLTQIRGARAVGRMVINLPLLMREPTGSADDVVLRGGDQLIVPRTQQQVTVLGEVQNATSLLYNPRLTRDDYISLSGGTTRRADRGRIYVVRANGSVVASEGSRWFASTSVAMKPGDTVVVPLNTEHLPPLPFWQAVTGILYNVAIAVAAIHAL